MIDPNDFDDEAPEPLAHPNAARFATAPAPVAEGLEKAKREMAELKASLDNVAERMAALDARATAPDTVRRTTLYEVWEKLSDAGNIAGAFLVKDLITAEWGN